MKLMDITNPNRTPDSEFAYLESRIRSVGAVAFEVEMPEGCEPHRTKLVFSCENGVFCLRLSRAVQYFGENPVLAEFCASRTKQFDSADEMRLYLRSMQPQQARTVQAAQQRRRAEMPHTNRDVLNLNAQAQGTRLDPGQLFDDLTETVRGQEDAVRCLVRYACAATAKQNPQRPPSIVLAGETGQGKTLAGKTLADAMNRQIHDPSRQYGTIVVQCNELTENHDVSRLLGGSPNYVGYGDDTLLSPLASNPYQVIIFDEIEKAAPRVLDVLMGAMDAGEIMMSKPIDGNSMLNLKHSILLFTTNMRLNQAAPKKKIGFDSGGASPAPADMTVRYRDAMVAQGMRREIAARFSEIVCFRPLSPDTVVDILLLEIQHCAEEFGFEIRYVAPQILQELYDKVHLSGFGARMIRRLVSNCFDLLFAEQTAGVSYDLTGSLDAPELKPSAAERAP